MCKLIRTQSAVLSLVREVEYVKEVFEKETAPSRREKDERPGRIIVLDAR